MCLIYAAWRRHARYRFVVAANRDEYHARPAASAHASCADTGSDLGPMRWRSSRFILGGDYGTRTSTVVVLDAGGAGVFVERSFDSSGTAVGDAVFELGTGGASREFGRGSRLAGVPGRPAPTGPERKEARDEP